MPDPDEIRVLVPLSPGFEEIEAVTVIDVMRRAGFEVVAAGYRGAEPIEASNGVVITPDAALAEVIQQKWSLVAIPGGLKNTANLSEHQPLLDLIRRRFEDQMPVAAICAAPKVLKAAGISTEVELTSHPIVQDDLVGAVKRYLEETVVDDPDHPVTTSRGAGTAMQWALHLVERLGGREKRESVEVGLALRPPSGSAG
jgi:4-methyl-5(b-hydroxyethyl)-thiazole monophosphate biosynthesis